MGRPAQNNTLIELHVPDFEIAKDYYGKLGFEVVWERQPEGLKGYLVMQRENNILCFWAGNDKAIEHSYFQQFAVETHRGYAVELVLMVKDLDAFYEEAKKVGKVVEEMKQQPWGLRDFRLEDPFGFYLRFTTPHNILDTGNAVT